MNKENYSQLDLFHETKNQASRNIPSRISLWAYAKNHERVLLLAISFLITAVAAFSVGVEKGKNITTTRAVKASGLDMAMQEGAPQLLRNKTRPAAGEVTLTLKKAPAIQPMDNKSIALANKPQGVSASGYTIQLATYRSKSYAQSEASNLKKKGLSPIVLSKKGFTILCVGSFSDKASAQTVLSDMKKRYPDCIIRRL